MNLFILPCREVRCNWSEVDLCSQVQRKCDGVGSMNVYVSVSPNTIAQTECSAVFILTSACTLMYHREVRIFQRALWAVAEIGRQDGLRIRWRKS